MKLASEVGLDLSDTEMSRAACEMIAAADPPIADLDFSQCILDYPATAHVVAATLRELISRGASRHVVIRFDVPFSEDLLLKWFFHDGGLIQESDAPSLRAPLRDALEKWLAANKCRVSVEVVRGDQVTRYDYGTE